MSTAVTIDIEAGITSIQSIYIPRIFNNITKEDINHIFEVLELGEVDRIDLVARPKGDIQTNMAFIHFKTWSNSIAAQNLAKRILDPEREARLVYDDPWYWVLLPNRNPLPEKSTEVDDRFEKLTSIVEGMVSTVNHLQSRLDALVSIMLPKPKLSRQQAMPISKSSSTSALPRLASLTSLTWLGDGSDSKNVAILLSDGNSRSRSSHNDDTSSDTWVIDVEREVELEECEMGTRRLAKIAPAPIIISDRESTRSISPDQRTRFDYFGNRFVERNGEWFKDNGDNWCDP